MPELPEVETTRRGIEPLVLGKQVEQVLIHNAALRWPIPSELDAILPAQKVCSVERRSKYLLMNFERGTLIIHLGMTGHLRVCRPGEERRKHDHVEMLFSDHTVLRFNDSRRFGAIFWTETNPLLHERLVNLGPEGIGGRIGRPNLGPLRKKALVGGNLCCGGGGSRCCHRGAGGASKRSPRTKEGGR